MSWGSFGSPACTNVVRIELCITSKWSLKAPESDNNIESTWNGIGFWDSRLSKDQAMPQRSPCVTEYPLFFTVSIHWVKPSHTGSGLRTLAFSGKLGATWAKNITCWVTIWADARPKKICGLVMGLCETVKQNTYSKPVQTHGVLILKTWISRAKF